jgi:hypothetical protein
MISYIGEEAGDWIGFYGSSTSFPLFCDALKMEEKVNKETIKYREYMCVISR